MDRNEIAREKVRKAYEERYSERDRQRTIDQHRAERVMLMKRFHGEDAPEYPEFDREMCMAVVQVYHQRPFELETKAPVEVNRKASMLEWQKTDIATLREFVADMIANSTKILSAPAAPINIAPDVFQVMMLLFNRFIDLCMERRPDLRKKWRKWEMFDSTMEIE